MNLRTVGRAAITAAAIIPLALPPAFAQPEQPPQFSRAQLRVLSARPQYEPRFALLELLHRQEALS